MNVRQINKLAMYHTVDALVEREQQTWKGLPAFASGVADFRKTLKEIKALGLAEFAPIGAADVKSDAVEDLITLAFEVAAATRVCARRSGDVVLAARVRFSRTTLGRGRIANMLTRCRDIHEQAAGRVPLLADYGVTPEKITRLKELIATGETLQSKPRETLVSAGVARKRLHELLRDVDAILDDLDGLCVQFRATHGVFCDEYTSARAILHYRATRVAPAAVDPQPQVTPMPDHGSSPDAPKKAA